MSKKVRTNDFFESEEIFRSLFENSPDAILVVDPHDPNNQWPILLCNDAAALMHGYDNKEILLSQSLRVLWAEDQDLTVIIGNTHQQKTITRDVLHRKQNGTIFPVNYICTQINLKNVKLLMVVVHDETDIRRQREAEDRFRAIFDYSPDGIVIIDPTKSHGKWLIEDCNDTYLRMNGFNDRMELIGQDINSITNYPEPREKYYQELKDERIVIEATHIRKDGSQFPFQASVCLVILNGHERILGIDRDVSEEKRIHEIIEDLQRDVGRTFHTLSASLLQVQLALTPAIRALGPDPFKQGVSPTTDEVSKELVGFRNNLIFALQKLINKESILTGDDLSQEYWSRLNQLLSILVEIEDRVLAEQRVSVLQRIAYQVIDTIDKMRTDKIQTDFIQEVKHSAKQLERITCLVILRKTNDRVIDTDYIVRDLRERIVTGVERDEKPAIYELWDLLKEATVGLADYASFKELAFRMDNRSSGAQVKVVKRNVVRAINNLLHNAIKYSWWRDQNRQPWINIQSYVKEKLVYIEIEDYGVPIPQDEIQKDLIFQLGYRGRLSGTRGIMGTGIGLADARQVIRSNGGDVTMISRPALRNASPDDLSVPHLKTATLYLPIYSTKKNGGRHEAKTQSSLD